MSDATNNPNLPIAIPDPDAPVPRVHLDALPQESRLKLKDTVHRGHTIGYTPSQLEAMFGVSENTIKKWIKEENWGDDREEHKKKLLFLETAPLEQKLELSGSNLSNVVFLMSDVASKAMKETGELPPRFPMKVLLEVVDKLTRLKMHVDSGGVEKKANINVDLSQNVIQAVVMEVAIELERRYPQINSKDLVADLFNKKLKKVLEKLK